MEGNIINDVKLGFDSHGCIVVKDGHYYVYFDGTMVGSFSDRVMAERYRDSRNNLLKQRLEQ